MPRGTAWDVVEYERRELGNENTLLTSKKILKSIPARNCVWVTKSKRTAKEYGEASHYLTLNKDEFTYCATDNMGGYLIAVL